MKKSRVDILDFPQAEIVAVLDLVRAYVDVTGDYKDPSCLAVGVVGLIGPVQEWHKLQSKWEDALECCRVDRFHGTDLQNFAQDYEGWTTYQRERFLSLLVRVVQESIESLRLIGASTVMQDFMELPEERKKRARTPLYLGAVWTILQTIWRAHEDFGDKPVEIIFDQEQKEVQSLNEAYDEARIAEHGHLLAGLTRGNHRLISPIQVADLVAYETKKYLDAKLTNISLELPELRWPVQQLEHLFFSSKAAFFDKERLMLATEGGNGETKEQ